MNALDVAIETYDRLKSSAIILSTQEDDKDRSCLDLCKLERA